MAMDYGEFVTTVEREAGILRPEARRAVRAALETLAERLTGGEARDLADRLPEQLRPFVADGEEPEPFGIEEYLHRVARREEVDEATAARHALAVFTALGRAVGRDEVHDMAAELPKDFALLLAAAEAAAGDAERREVVAADEFVTRVADRTGLDADAARRAVDAVLDALGERITDGQAEDLAAWLPDELREPLERGNARGKGEGRPLSRVEFERRVSDHEGVSPEVAREHARAVLAVLRESVPEKEFSDTVAQLPADYRPLLA
ncbi:MAG: hypothetical protein QOD55_1985 [Solirubrobacteraceae bacterium]|nr:hypothetical protein [Solirubrobacteraceae bacterium]